MAGYFIYTDQRDMDKIASPQELQTELRRLLAYCQDPKPSRVKLAHELQKLAQKVLTATVKKLPSVGATQRWSVVQDGTEIGLIEKNRSTKSSLEPYHAMIGKKTIGSFYDENEAKKSPGLVGDNLEKKLRSQGSWGDGLALAVKAIEAA